MSGPKQGRVTVVLRLPSQAFARGKNITALLYLLVQTVIPRCRVFNFQISLGQ
jgi:hypothetical protein